jgi:hypothetical protein
VTSPLWDFKIFGSGFGMAMPFWNGIFYWLNDESKPNWYSSSANDHSRSKGKLGDFYTFAGGLGAQLHSYQWTHPNAGETRVLAGKRFRPLHSHRRWFRVEVSWYMTGLDGKDIDTINKEIREFQAELLKSR